MSCTSALTAGTGSAGTRAQVNAFASYCLCYSTSRLDRPVGGTASVCVECVCAVSAVCGAVETSGGVALAPVAAALIVLRSSYIDSHKPKHPEKQILFQLARSGELTLLVRILRACLLMYVLSASPATAAMEICCVWWTTSADPPNDEKENRNPVTQVASSPRLRRRARRHLLGLGAKRSR